MTIWLIVVIISYAVTAIAAIIDKFVLDKPQIGPGIYAFYVGLLNLAVLALIPFGFTIPSFGQILIALSSGVIFMVALLVFYKALETYEASRVVPVAGGLLPIFSLLLSYLILGEILSIREFWAFLVLVAGSVFISVTKTKHRGYSLRAFGIVALYAFLFAASYVLAKVIFLHQPFISGFIWTRLGSPLVALVLFMIPGIRKNVFESLKIRDKTPILFLSSKSCGALGFILVNYAIAIGSVTLTNALQGLEYIFVLVFSFILALKFPGFIKEEFTKKIIFQKIAGIILIEVGIVLLVIK